MNTHFIVNQFSLIDKTRTSNNSQGNPHYCFCLALMAKECIAKRR